MLGRISEFVYSLQNLILACHAMFQSFVLFVNYECVHRAGSACVFERRTPGCRGCGSWRFIFEEEVCGQTVFYAPLHFFSFSM